jgi:hypothetical protein
MRPTASPSTSGTSGPCSQLYCSPVAPFLKIFGEEFFFIILPKRIVSRDGIIHCIIYMKFNVFQIRFFFKFKIIFM